MSFKHLTVAALEQEHAELAQRARELTGKRSPAARREAQANAARFTEITRELKRRKDDANGRTA